MAAPSSKFEMHSESINAPSPEYTRDLQALAAGGRLHAGGHPVLRALWIDRIAVFSGLLILFYIPLGFALSYGVSGVEEFVIVEPEPIIIPEETDLSPGGAITLPDFVQEPVQNTIPVDPGGALIGSDPPLNRPDALPIEEPVIEPPVIVEESAGILCTIFGINCDGLF